MKIIHQQWYTEQNQGRPIGIIVFQTMNGRKFIKIGTGGGLDKEMDADMIYKFGKEITLEKLKAVFEVCK